MSRTAILPTPGDPLLLRFWLRHYEQVWANEVDTLIVAVNTTAGDDVCTYIKELVPRTSGAQLNFTHRQTDHGKEIDVALEYAGDFTMLIEDDAFVLKSGQVAGCFETIEKGIKDVVGSPRASCSDEITEYAQERWGLMQARDGDVGVNFWPNFFFCHTKRLTETDRNFCAKSWQAGELIPGVEMVARDFCLGDTFVNTSLQIRAKQPNIAIVPQYHAHPHDMEQRMVAKGLWDGLCPWFHIGSLSSGFTGVLTDAQGRPLSDPSKPPAPDGWELPKYANTEMERIEWERRVVFWQMALESADEDPDNPIPEFREKYRAALTRLIQQYGLSPSRIIRSTIAYKELMTWKI